jgi:hypothetical protein
MKRWHGAWAWNCPDRRWINILGVMPAKSLSSIETLHP